MDHAENLKAAAIHYGLEAQLRKTLEELEELKEAIKAGRFEGDCGIYEEIADVYNMLDQIVYLTDSEDLVQDVAEQKMRRTIRRMKEEAE